MEISGFGSKNQRYQLLDVRSTFPFQSLSLSKLLSDCEVIKKFPVMEYTNANSLILIALNHRKSNDSHAIRTKLGWVIYGP